MEVPTSIAVGVARPNAQGHETTYIVANKDMAGINHHYKLKELKWRLKIFHLIEPAVVDV